jgi:hypothetical protein
MVPLDPLTTDRSTSFDRNVNGPHLITSTFGMLKNFALPPGALF